MKDIKFKAWDAMLGGMETVVEICFDDDRKVNGVRYGNSEGTIGRFNDLSDVCIMQFTGLKDKNKREVYDNDVIMVEIKEDRDWVAVRGYIEWSEHACGYVFRCGAYEGESDSYHPYQCRSFEVIGNIYENPELLQ